MKKSILFGLIFASLITVSILVAAAPNNQNKPLVPTNAVEVAPGVFSLGQAKDVDGRVVEGFMFIRDKKGDAKPPWAGGGNNGGSTTSTCYALMAKGARWKTTEPYSITSDINSAVMSTSLNTWDSEVGFNIFGPLSTDAVDGADSNAPDGKNEVMFSDLGPTNTIAYTIVWGIFSGPPSQRELVEWDMVFNSAYTFGNADSPDGNNVMDFQNIATHEAGHALGLDHPDSTCTEETMYAYANYGETKKRDLNSGASAGINVLY